MSVQNQNRKLTCFNNLHIYYRLQFDEKFIISEHSFINIIFMLFFDNKFCLPKNAEQRDFFLSNTNGF